MWQRIFIVIFIVYIAIVSYLSLSIPTGITDISSWDKLAHGMAYFGFAMFCGIIARHRQQLAKLLFLCAGYGILIEYLQSLTTYRQASFADEIANLTGLLVGTIILHGVHFFIPLACCKKKPENQTLYQ